MKEIGWSFGAGARSFARLSGAIVAAALLAAAAVLVSGAALALVLAALSGAGIRRVGRRGFGACGAGVS